jgi:hypothetical protein
MSKLILVDPHAHENEEGEGQPADLMVCRDEKDALVNILRLAGEVDLSDICIQDENGVCLCLEVVCNLLGPDYEIYNDYRREIEKRIHDRYLKGLGFDVSDDSG